MDNEAIKLLLVKYITKQATENEITEVKYWLALHPENELYFVELYEAWQNMLYSKTDFIDEEKAYELFIRKTSTVKQNKRSTMWLKVAALLIFALSVSVFIIRYQSAKLPKNNQVVAQKGAVKKIILNDGTIVWLNAGSSIKYDDNFDKTNRTVYLEGEAFFEIGHNTKNIPFLVNSKKYTIRDIGTKFNLKAYPNDPLFEVTVVKGEVAVEATSASDQHNFSRIYVKPQQVLKIFNHPDNENAKNPVHAPKSYNELQVSQIDSSKMEVYDGWKDDLLIFDGNTLDEIARVLERRYDIKITIDNTDLQNIRYSGSFKSVPDIDKVLDIIKQNTPIAYTIAGKTITITKTN